MNASERDPIDKRGIYLMADTPLAAHPLAIEGGGGDKRLLGEALAEQLEQRAIGALIQRLIEESNRRAADGDEVRGHGVGDQEPLPRTASGLVTGDNDVKQDATASHSDLAAARLSVDDAIVQCPDADGRAGEHLSEARYHLREAAQLLDAQEVLR